MSQVIMKELDARTVERIYARAIALQNRSGSRESFLLKQRGMNMARARYAPMLRVLEQGAEVLRRMNDEQASRFAQKGIEKSDFTEYATWREALLKITDWSREEEYKYGVFAWIYAAVGEYVLPPG